MTECGPENCDHCFDTRGKIRLTQSQECFHYDFDDEVARGHKPMFPDPVKVTIAMAAVFSKDEYNELPLVVVEGVKIT